MSFKAEFSVSHDFSEIILICWFGAQETFLNIINVENSCELNKESGIFDK